MTEWIKAQLWEIKNSTALKYLGVILALSHFATFWIWKSALSPLWTNVDTQGALCWSFFPNCFENLLFRPDQFQALLLAYGGLGAMAILGLIAHRFIFFGWLSLAMTFLFHLFFLISDYSLASNTQTLLVLFVFCFLFIPQKTFVAKLLIFSSYIAFGLLKLNADWLSGFWLADRFPSLPIKGIEWLAVFSILIEILAPFGLFSRIGQRFLLGFGFLTFYHLLQLVFLDPLTAGTQLALLIFFAVSFVERKRLEREYIYQSYIRPQPSRAWVAAVMLLFWSLQVLPLWVHHPILKENPLRLQAHPVPIQCIQQNLALFDDRTLELPESQEPMPTPELKCNPFIRFSYAKSFCELFKNDPKFESVASFFLMRKLSEDKFRRVFELTNICDDKVQFHRLEPTQ